MIGKKFWILLIGTTGCLMGLIFFARLHKPPTAAQLMKQHSAEMAKVDKEWGQFNFISLGDESLQKHIDALVTDSTKAYPLVSEQAGLLSSAVLVFFQAYNKGTYESYKAFRMPPDVPFDLTTNRLGSLEHALKTGKTVALPKALVRWRKQKRTDWKKISTEEKIVAYLKLYSGDTLYSNYFTAISIEQSRIVLTNCATKPIPWAFETSFSFPISTNSTASAPTPFPNMGYFSQRNYTFIKFKNSMEQIQNLLGKVTLADCLLFLKRSDADGFIPVIVRFYWEPDGKRWLPDDLVVCNVNQKGDLWPIF